MFVYIPFMVYFISVNFFREEMVPNCNLLVRQFVLMLEQKDSKRTI